MICNKLKKHFTIFLCGNCGMRLYARRTQKTKQCIRCKKNINIERAKKIGFYETEQDAISALKYFKVPKDLRKQVIEEITDKIDHKPVKLSSIERFKNLLNELSQQNTDRLIDIQLLYEKAESIGIEKYTVKRYLEELITSGTLYEPKLGFYGLI